MVHSMYWEKQRKRHVVYEMIMLPFAQYARFAWDGAGTAGSLYTSATAEIHYSLLSWLA